MTNYSRYDMYSNNPNHKPTHKNVFIFTIIILILATIISGFNFSWAQSLAENPPPGSGCYYHSDGEYESALAYSTTQYSYPANGFYAELYEIPSGNTLTGITYQFCSKVKYGGTRYFDAVVWNMDENGGPGDILWEVNDVEIDSLNTYPHFMEYFVSVNSPNPISGTIFVGFRPHYSTNYLMYMIGADFSNWGKPYTFSPSVGKWVEIRNLYSSVRSIGIGICYDEVQPPVAIQSLSTGQVKVRYIRK